MITTMKKIYPGLLLAILLACLGQFIATLLPYNVIGSSVIAMFLGILINPFLVTIQPTLQSGIQFASKKVLKFAIICLGASLNIATILNVGQLSLLVMFFTLLTCFGGGYVIGKFLGLDWKLSSLISAGTGICGGSAIAAIAPVIDDRRRRFRYRLCHLNHLYFRYLNDRPLSNYGTSAKSFRYCLWSMDWNSSK